MNRIIQGDCMEEMQKMGENSVHAVVTDPPYNYEDGFGGESWDDIGSGEDYQKWCKEWSEECKRVLKPGGHLIAFSGRRFYHRLASGVENAGYEIRDQIPWIYAGKMAAGPQLSNWLEGGEEEKWGDWRPMLKPCHESVVLARAPLGENSSTKNQVEYGVGNLNVEECRISTIGEESLDGGRSSGMVGEGTNDVYKRDWWDKEEKVEERDEEIGERVDHAEEEGRFPPNVAIDSVMADLINEMGREIMDHDKPTSRFFFCSKAGKGERTHNGEVKNDHPTVKPVDLMKWLIKLVTAEGQTVLDPFAGSGTTGVAAEKVDREYILIEMDEEYVNLAEERLGNVEGGEGDNMEEDEKAERQGGLMDL